jgi:hypothetical protein
MRQLSQIHTFMPQVSYFKKSHRPLLLQLKCITSFSSFSVLVQQSESSNRGDWALPEVTASSWVLGTWSNTSSGVIRVGTAVGWAGASVCLYHRVPRRPLPSVCVRTPLPCHDATLCRSWHSWVWNCCLSHKGSREQKVKQDLCSFFNLFFNVKNTCLFN